MVSKSGKNYGLTSDEIVKVQQQIIEIKEDVDGNFDRKLKMY